MSTDKILQIEQAWLTHIYDGFPRDYRLVPISDDDYVRKYNISNRQNYIYIMWKYHRLYNQYCALYPEHFIRVSPMRINKIYIDMDVTPTIGIKECYIAAKALVEYIQNTYKCIPRVYFTGKKGFHIFIDIPLMEVYQFRSVIHRFVQDLCTRVNDIYNIPSILGLDTSLDTSTSTRPSNTSTRVYNDLIDHQVILDKARVSRIPYTYNLGGQKFCIPVDILNDSLEYIKKEAIKPTEWKALNITVATPSITDELKKYDTEMDLVVNDDAMPETYIVSNGDSRRKKYLQEVDWLFEQAPRVRGGRHRILHFYLVPRLIFLAYENTEVARIVRKWIDKTDTYERKPTEHYVKYAIDSTKRIRREGWMPWRIETLFANYPDIFDYFGSD